MKIIAVDDEMSALNDFLYNIVDRPDIQSQMFLNDPQGAIVFAKEHQVDAAFLDILMPKMNGIELAKQLIKVCPKIRIFFITSYTFDEGEVAEQFGKNFSGFCYKPYDRDLLGRQLNRLQEMVENRKDPVVYIKTFDTFDVFVDGTPVVFRSKKSKELLAFVINCHGSYADMDLAANALWPNKDSDVGKISYRDAVWKLRKCLNENGLDTLVTFSRGSIKANLEAAKCDLWDLLEGKSEVVSIVSYLPGYEWSASYEAEIMDLLEVNMEKKLSKEKV